MDITQILQNLGFGPEIVTLIVSMIPVVELRGAIPVGVYLGLPVWKAAIISVIGNMIPVPFVIALCRIIFDYIKTHIKFLNGLVKKIELKAEKNRELISKSEFFGLLFFVAIPFPGTGAWTGAMIASILNLRLKTAIPSIFMGVLLACGIISLGTLGVLSFI